MYQVCLALDSYKSESDPTRRGVQTLTCVDSVEQAQAALDWVVRDLQAKGYYIDHLRCYANDQQGFTDMLQVAERLPYTGDPEAPEIRFIGFVFYIEDR